MPAFAKLKGRIKVPGDKSITHRALVFSLLARGTCTLIGPSPAEDCRSTMSCLERLGLHIEGRKDKAGEALSIRTPGLSGLTPPAGALYAGNSGTTIRLLSGVLAGRPFTATLDGDRSLQARPMARVLDPLRQMGARVEYMDREGCAPFSITGGGLRGISFDCPVASAQVQTALLLAGLQAEGQTTIRLPGRVRDHTTRMFLYLGVPHTSDGTGTVTVSRLAEPVPPFATEIPGDLSSAAFFLVAAALLPGSHVVLANCGINPGRTLVLDVLTRMGAEVTLKNVRQVGGEPVADICVGYGGRLAGTTIAESEIASGIDEIPILALAGALSRGIFSVRGASELRVKESDRLSAIVSNLRGIGAIVTEHADGFEIEGQERLRGGAFWRTLADHRLAMTGLVARQVCREPIEMDDVECARISYPSFQEDLQSLLS